jgi:segregation and condensation protein B
MVTMNINSQLPALSLKGRIEAALFATGHPLTLPDLSDLLRVDQALLEEAMGQLIQDYAFKGDDCALEVDDSDGYILQIKEDYAAVVSTLMPMDLSSGALRTLSVVALKAPILQSDLVTLRGASAYDHISELLEKKLVAKHREGRSFRLKTTRTFDTYFKLNGDKKELEALLAPDTGLNE